MQLAKLTDMMTANGVKTLYFKRLVKNNNSKNQIYLGTDFAALNLFPLGPIQPDPKKPQIFKAPLKLHWLQDDGTTVHAPASQLIFYPQYPEVRLGSVIKGASGKGPSAALANTVPGRILFLGATSNGVVAYLADAGSPLAKAVNSAKILKQIGVFEQLPTTAEDPRLILLDALRTIHLESWIDSYRLDATGAAVDCKAPNCGGLTLEARLGIRPNSNNAPDFHGWEIKAHSTNIITLMTPEPTGGHYADGFISFIKRYGYKDLKRTDRYNFNARHFVCQPSSKTGLHLVLDGFDSATGQITNAAGGIVLFNAADEVAAMWPFAELMSKWNRKHAFAAYVTSERRTAPSLQYRFGRHIQLGEGTDFLLFLAALAARKAYYDPGCKLEAVTSTKPEPKKRNQFRIAVKDLGSLYAATSTVDLLGP